jgi:DNA-binding transcriptional regulator YdaS (Cro superfamily)
VTVVTDETLPEERLAALLALLPPAPAGWVEAATQLPAARAQIDSIVERAERDAGYRAEVLADLERALAADGITPAPSVTRELARRLEGG